MDASVASARHAARLLEDNLRPKQPLRNRAYKVGLAVMLALCGHIVWGVLGG